MFTKKSVISAQNKLRGSDAKNLKKAAAVALPYLPEADLDAVFPSKADVFVAKVNHRALVYFVGSEKANPLFFDPEGDGELYPTCYLVWQFPKCMPSVWTYSEVSPKVLGGADLMLPGFILEPGQEWEQGQRMLCSVKDHPFPFAVGVMEISSRASRESGMKGRGLKLLHHYPDTLWAMGDKAIPDLSFTPSRIYPMGTGPAAAGAAAAAADKAAEKVAALDLAAAQSAAEAAPSPSAADGPSASASASDRGGGDSAAASPSGAGPAPPGDAATHVPEGMDKCLDYALLRAIATVPDSDIPCQFEKFYSGHILPNRPPGTNVDVKKSGYKKLAKLLSTWEKKGALTTKVVHKQDTVVGDVVAAAESMRAAEAQQAADAPSASAGSSAAAAAAAAAPADSAAAQITAIPVFRVPSSIKPLIGDAPDKDRLYTTEEVFAALEAYGKANGLLPAGDSEEIKLDSFLVSLQNKKERGEVGALASKGEIQQLVLQKLQLFTKLIVTRNGRSEEVLKKGDVKNIHVGVEDRHAGRKFITKVSGLEYFGIDIDEFSVTLQKKHNTSASVGDLPGKNETGKEVMIQGNLLQEILVFLETKYGIPSNYIDTTNRTK